MNKAFPTFDAKRGLLTVEAGRIEGDDVPTNVPTLVAWLEARYADVPDECRPSCFVQFGTASEYDYEPLVTIRYTRLETKEDVAARKRDYLDRKAAWAKSHQRSSREMRAYFNRTAPLVEIELSDSLRIKEERP